MICTSAPRRSAVSCSVHRNVSTADNRNFLSSCNRCVVILPVCFHQIVSGQVLVCREHAVCLFARDSHKHRETCAGTDEDCLISLFLHQFINGDRFSDNYICLNIYAERFDILDFSGNNLVFRKTEFRNSIAEHAACLMERLKNCHLISETGKIAGAGKAGRTGTDHCNLMAVLLCRSGGLYIVLLRPVSDKTLQFSDGYRIALDSADTFPSHWLSCGQTRPQTAGRALDSLIIL